MKAHHEEKNKKLLEKNILNAIGTVLAGSRDWDGGRKDRAKTYEKENQDTTM